MWKTSDSFENNSIIQHYALRSFQTVEQCYTVPNILFLGSISGILIIRKALGIKGILSSEACVYSHLILLVPLEMCLLVHVV